MAKRKTKNAIRKKVILSKNQIDKHTHTTTRVEITAKIFFVGDALHDYKRNNKKQIEKDREIEEDSQKGKNGEIKNLIN